MNVAPIFCGTECIGLHRSQLSVCRPHLAAMSSSSPPQPQYWLGKPFIFMYWSGVTADTPPKYCGYGSLRGTHQQCARLEVIMSEPTDDAIKCKRG